MNLYIDVCGWVKEVCVLDYTKWDATGYLTMGIHSIGIYLRKVLKNAYKYRGGTQIGIRWEG